VFRPGRDVFVVDLTRDAHELALCHAMYAVTHLAMTGLIELPSCVTFRGG
jgi:hypothetical protein